MGAPAFLLHPTDNPLLQRHYLSIFTPLTFATGRADTANTALRFGQRRYCDSRDIRLHTPATVRGAARRDNTQIVTVTQRALVGAVVVHVCVPAAILWTL